MSLFSGAFFSGKYWGSPYWHGGGASIASPKLGGGTRRRVFGLERELRACLARARDEDEQAAIAIALELLS